MRAPSLRAVIGVSGTREEVQWGWE
jgi:hypothetical protein